MDDIVVLRADRENLSKRVSELLEENERLRQRTKPNHVVMINGVGHYVNDAVRDALEAIVWKPVGTAPKDGTSILMYKPRSDGGFDVNKAWWDGEVFRGHGWRYSPHNPPTHWLSLPSPPTDPTTGLIG